MNEVTALVQKLTDVVSDIPVTLKKQKAAGKKLVGVFPVYEPEELIYAAGMLPVGCWGGQMEISKATSLLPPFACPVMQGITELSLSGAYDILDGAMISTPCDTLKCLSQNFLSTNPKVKAIFCVYPQNNKLEAGVSYLLEELHKVGRELEVLSGNAITEAKLKNSIDVYNENRAVMTEFSQLLAKNPGCLTVVERHNVIKSRYFMDKKEHTGIMKELNSVLRKRNFNGKKHKKLYLAGIMTEPVEFLSIIDELGYTIVGDELAYESRQFRNPVPQGIDQYERLARQWQNVEGCSLVYDPTFSRGKRIANEAQDSHADGVLYCQMKFCEAEEFDYPYIRANLEQVNIPVLNIEIDPLTVSQEQSRTRLQAFAEQITL